MFEHTRKAQAQIAAAADKALAPNGELNLEFLNDDQSLDFGRLKG